MESRMDVQTDKRALLETMMKAVRMHVRGGPDQIVYEDIPRPIPSVAEGLDSILYRHVPVS